MTQDLNAGSTGATSLPKFTNDVYGHSSTMVAPLLQNGYPNAAIPHFNMYGNYSVTSAPYIGGEYTSLLPGVDQAATLHYYLMEYQITKICNLAGWLCNVYMNITI
jgi:hypothetical protein